MRDPITLGTVLSEKRRALREADTKVFNRTNSLNEALAEQEALRDEIKALAAEFQAVSDAILAPDQTAIFNAGADFDAASRSAMDDAFQRATNPNGQA